MDNDPEDPGDSDPSNVDSNKGLVSNDYDYYTDMMNEMKILNDRLYNLADYFDKKESNPTPAGEITNVYPEADANYKDAVNEGSAEQLAVKEASPYRQALVRFDLSTIPADAAYIGFQLTGVRTITDPQKNVYVIDVVDGGVSWSETGLVKSNMPTSSYIAPYIWNTNTGITTNVTNYVKEAQAKGRQKITFKIRVGVQGTPDYMAFGSRENPDVSKRPVLQYAMQVQNTGIEQANMIFGKPVAVRYFNLQGMEIAHPQRGNIYIVQTLFDSNQFINSKVLF
jgi:hypothetical protein